MLARLSNIPWLGHGVLATWTLVLVAWSSFVALHDGDVPRRVGIMLVCGVLVMVSARLKIDASTRLNEGTTWSMNSAVQYAMLVVLGPSLVIPGVACGLFLQRRLEGGRFLNCLVNATMGSTALLAGGAVYEAFGADAGDMSLPGYYPALLASAIVWALVSELVIAAVFCVVSPNWRIAVRNEAAALRQFLPATAIEGLIGAMVGVVCLLEPWAVFVVLPLGGSLYIAMRRGVRVQQVTEEALETFANIVDERDRYTFEHSTRVTEYSMMIGEELGLTDAELKSLYWTSRLHDLGKIAVENSILNKPGPLDDAEFEVMKTHPVVSARILESFAFDRHAADVVRCHHERFDGRGYLRRPGADVPLLAFIIAVADSFDAMTSDRPYRRGMAIDAAIEEVRRNIGTQFHPACAEAFLRAWAARQEAAEPEDGPVQDEPGSLAA